MGAYFRGMADGLQQVSPEDLARFRDMLADLNDMIERRERGEPSTSTGSCSDTGTSSRAIPRRSTSCSRTWRAAWRP